MAKVKVTAKKKYLCDKRLKPHENKKVMNPFEVHVNRQKYDVLGRKSKNDKGLPGIARAKAVSKRKKTLLQEYKIKDKSNKFLDRRIGEKNSAMTREDRIVARFTAERMKIHNRKSIFNLGDDEILTHDGQTLNEIEKFDDPRSDDEQEEKLDADFVEDAHFGGGILKKVNNETSRRNLIDQLIAESKKRKAEKQRAKEQTIELTEKLDTEWRNLLPIVSALNKSMSSLADDDKPVSYDTIMRQLKFEARGKPSDKIDLLAQKKILEQATEELTYTYEIPSTYEKLQTLLNAHDYDQQAIILERMIKCNHPSLGEGFKDKLATLFAFLLQHLQDTAVSGNNCFALLDRLAPQLYDLCHVSEENAGHCIREVIREKQQDFRFHSRSYPGLDTLVFLKLVSLLFPTSDFRHPIVTPALTFMCQMLNQCRVRTEKDVSTGLYLATLLLEYTVLSKRFSPSAINFLHGVIDIAVPKMPTELLRVVHPIYISTAARNLLVVEETSIENHLETGLMGISDLRGETSDHFKIRALHTSVKLVQEFCENLKYKPSSYQIFAPVLNTINKLDLQRYPPYVVDSVKSLVCSIEAMSQQKLQFLAVEKKKPKALRLYEPKIERVIDGKRKRPVGRERQEREKLLHKYKREMKGAVREIRRDKAFLAKIKLKETLKNDLERKQKVKEIFGSAAMQQGELRKLKRKK